MKKTLTLSIIMVLTSLFFLSFYNKPLESRILVKCKNLENTRQCEEQEVIKVLNTKGVRNAFVAVEKLKEQDPEFGPPCHAFVHVVGIAAYNLAIKGMDVFAMPLSACEVAYIHGLMMEVVMHPRESQTNDFAFASELCKKIIKEAKNDSGIYYQCYHGIGHGLPLYFYSIGTGEVKSVLANSLYACDQYFEAHFFCKIGVYGGLGFLLTGDHGLTIKGFGMKEMFDICSNSETEIRPNCYEMMAPALVFLVNDDVHKAIFFMNKYIPSDSDKVIMARQIGQSITTYKDNVSPQEVKEICDEVNGESHLACIEGYMNGYVDSAPDKDNINKQAMDICNSGVFNDKEVVSCRKGAKI